MISPIGIVLLVAALFVVVGLLIFMVQKLVPNEALGKEIWLIYRLEFIVVGALLIPLYPGEWLFLVALVMFNLRAFWELLTVIGLATKSTLARTGFLLSTLALISLFLFGETVFWVACLLVVLLMLASQLVKQDPAHEVLKVISCMFLLLLPLAYILILRADEDGFLWLFMVYLVVEINDATALLVGKFAGRNHLFPVLSPGKTTEGMLAGMAISLLAGVSFCVLFLDLNWSFSLAAVLLALLTGIVGDLFFSALKRHHRSKDFPPLHQSTGGVLDIYDSFLFAAPAFYFCLLLAG